MRIIRHDRDRVTVTMPLDDLLDLLRLDQRLYRLPSGSYVWLYDNGLLPIGAISVATPMDFLQEFPTFTDEVCQKITTSLSFTQDSDAA